MLATLTRQLAKALADPRPQERDAGAERILDAALEQFLHIGINRSSMEDVARRAGVSRITIYRRFPQKDRLVEAVLLREVRRQILGLREVLGTIPEADKRIEVAFVFMLRSMRNHPVTRLMTLEPDLVLPFMTLKGAPLIAIGTGFIAEQIRAGQREGAFPKYDPQPVAEILTRLAHSLLLTPQGGIPLMTDGQARAFARSHILPLLRHGDG